MKRAFRQHPVAAAVACVALFFGSFGDESAQVTFALRLADQGNSSAALVSALLSAGLVGGLFAGPLAPAVLHRVGPGLVISGVFVAEAVLIAVASSTSQLMAYIGVAAALGCAGSLLWSAVMVALPQIALSDGELDRANRIVQSVRNLGYVIGPTVGGFVYAAAAGGWGLLLIALMLLIAALAATGANRYLLRSSMKPETHTSTNGSRRGRLDLFGFLRTPGIVKAVFPLLVTVLVTSALNVLLIVRIRSDLHFGAHTYGFIVGTLSLGLVIGPLLFTAIFARFGDASGSSAAAAVIGAAIAGLALSEHLWALIITAAIIGVANGVQNTLMSSFVMKTIDAEHRSEQMPAYVLVLQASVLLGYVAAGFVSVERAAGVLLIVGIFAVMVGLAGAVANRTNIRHKVTERRPQ